MTRQQIFSMLLWSLLGTLGSVGWAVPAAAQEPEAIPTRDNAVHILAMVQGDVRVQREGWSRAVPARFGLLLRRGDLIHLDGAAQATVVCADLTVASPLPGGISGVPCPRHKPVLIEKGTIIAPLRSYQGGLFPLVVTPRKTKLLASRPPLRWTPVAGVTTYQVRVLQGADVLWHREASGTTTLTYPTGVPELVPGKTYLLEVVAGGHSSRKEEVPGLGFTLLKPQEAYTVRQEEYKIHSLPLAEAPRRFLIAKLYTTMGLYAEALEHLEELSTTFKEPVVLRLLGDIYLQLGLYRLAEERFVPALNLSQDTHDLEGQALAHQALGYIYSEEVGNYGEAVHHLRKAMAVYQQVGDLKLCMQIQEKVARLQSSEPGHVQECRRTP